MKVVLPAVVINNVLIVMHTYLGLGHLLGSEKATSTTYAVAFSWLPVNHWGWLVVAGAPLSLLAPWVTKQVSAALHVAAGLPLVAFAVGLVVAEVAGQNSGWGGPLLYLLPALMHAALIHARYSPESGRA